ncbi:MULTISPECIES: STAS domain-containing protein [Trichocoleus]|uniref:STAS domain-containing protein n=1 Tax=Trichocoleus desertorum GB2-A4 TaxID=2933944 RepID=A0ABV0J690_9CYAN|nr:STAS domain-containing protein [Trichocoleus sp. FACHB-46]MBD1861920.1 STAS domain-containing protein [Trichocoleus sp. FACHB-46]
MKTVINSTTNTLNSDAIGVEEEATTPTVVLQPQGCLNTASSPGFQQELEQALAGAASAVIVDLLHVEAVEPAGVSVLLAGIKLATSLNKSLSIWSMSRVTRVALETEWGRQRAATLGTWSDLCKQEFELFLRTNSWARKQSVAAQAVAAQAAAKIPVNIPVPRRMSYVAGSTDLEMRTQQTA